MERESNRRILDEILNGKRKPNDLPGVGELYIEQSDEPGMVLANGVKVPEREAKRLQRLSKITIGFEDLDKPKLPDLGWHYEVNFMDGIGGDDFINEND